MGATAGATLSGVSLRGPLLTVGLAVVFLTSIVPGASAHPAAGPDGIHDESYAPRLKAAAHYTGASIRDTRLSAAAYALSKIVGVPHTIDVACWSAKDWPTVSGDGNDTAYETIAFWSPAMPHWVQLSPQICHAFETLLDHRPRYPNVITADAVETLAHETMHSVGVSVEAQAECYGMQLAATVAEKLGVPVAYANSLARLNLDNYKQRPPNYINTTKCREDGVWDLFPGKDSPPWHSG
jgi:hypothetical protein